MSTINVSVPSRGSIFLYEYESTVKYSYLVSVPSRGSIFLYPPRELIIRLKRKFPSPLGVLYFSMDSRIYKGD